MIGWNHDKNKNSSRESGIPIHKASTNLVINTIRIRPRTHQKMFIIKDSNEIKSKIIIYNFLFLKIINLWDLFKILV